MRPERTDDKYWTGTRDFNHIQYESDLEDYIIDLENETQQLRLHDVVKSLLNDEEVKAHIDTLPYYGTCTTEYNEGFEDGVKWLKEQIAK